MLKSSGKMFLDDLDNIRHNIIKLCEKKEELEYRATSVNISYNKIGGTNHGHTDKTGHSAILLQDNQERIDRLASEYKMKANLLKNYLKKVECDDGVSIIKMRHLEWFEWAEIINIMDASRTSVFRYYNKAINELSAILDSVTDKEITKLKNRTKRSNRVTA